MNKPQHWQIPITNNKHSFTNLRKATVPTSINYHIRDPQPRHWTTGGPSVGNVTVTVGFDAYRDKAGPDDVRWVK